MGTDRGPEVLLHRDSELAALDAALAEARVGMPCTVLIDGEAGVGKSALLRRLAYDPALVHVLDASGDELETATTYGIIEQLLRTAPPVPAADLGAVQRSPLVDAPTVGAQLLELLAAISADAPVLLLVDDVHWGDAASLHALTFALRRLRTEHVLAVLAGRRQQLHRLPPGLLRLLDGPRGLRLPLQGLPAEALADLAVLHGHERLSAGAAERLHRHTDGNPLHARALLEELDTEELEASVGETSLPAPRAFATLVHDRLAACSPDAARLVAAAAVLGQATPLWLAARLADLADPLAALEEAAGADLLLCRRGPDGNEADFTHGLVRAAVYHRLGPRRAAELHRRAAALVGDEAVALRHRAAASDPDEALAAEIAAFAWREAGRGAWTAAGAALVEAARLSPTCAEREDRLLDAVECLLLSGDRAGAAELAAQVDEVADTARARYIRGRLALGDGDWLRAERLLEDAWRVCDPVGDSRLAACTAGMLATLRLHLGDGPAAVRWARCALELDRQAAPLCDTPMVLLLGCGLSGETDEGLALADTLLDDAGLDPVARVGALTGRGALRLWGGDATAAVTDLADAYAASRRHGPFHAGHVALLYLADAEYRTGAWDEAVTHADAAISATSAADQTDFAPLVHGTAAFVRAARGEWDAAERHVVAAAEAAAVGHAGAVAWAATAGARLAHARGDHAAMLRELRPAMDREDAPSAAPDPAIHPWVLLAAEAHVRTGDQQRAVALLGRLERHERRPVVLAELHRLRGLLAAARADQATADAAFRAGLTHVETTTAPFVEAQLRLDYGSWLRHVHRRRAAREQLLRARDGLQRLAAQPYLQRCDRELRGCGATLGAGVTTPPRPSLTAQEQAVAELVARGATNREAADVLFVTVKTVEYHLGNIYRKLAIRSRTELALWAVASDATVIAASSGEPQRQ